MDLLKLKKNRILKTAVIFLILIPVVYFASTAAVAYWTDSISMQSSVSSLDIGIEYEEDALSIGKADSFLPGEMSDFSFKVVNTGSISADIRPVITVMTDVPMTIGGSEYVLCDENGEDISDEYEVSYYINEEEVDAASGEEFDKAVYSRKIQNTLHGSVHKDESLDLDTESGSLINEKQFICYLKLSENSGNEFMGASAEISVDTYAVQHRFSEGAVDEVQQDKA